jgi:ATP-binding protein involved in chromosome partitioning
MFGIAEGTRPRIKDQKWFVPIKAHGVEVMSMAFLTDDNTPMVWRADGFRRLAATGDPDRWGDLDYLVIDMPPGTGDIQLTLAQKVPVAGAVIVTTPQDLACSTREGRGNVPQGQHPGAGRGGEHGRAHLLQLRPCRASVR